MEKTEEGLGHMLDGLSIQPPRLEDAGLEDCALPPQSIMEAFSRAANSLKSRLTSQYHDTDDEDAGNSCIQDPGPTNGDIPDALVADSGTETLLCGGDVAAVGEGEVQGDEVVVVGGGGGDGDAKAASDRVLVLGEDYEEGGGDKACCPDDVGDVGVNKGFGGGKEKEEEDDDDDEEEDDEEEKKPILVETLI